MSARFAIALMSIVFTAACGSTEIAALCPTGVAGCPCYEDQTCQGLLVCADDGCNMPRCGDDVLQDGEDCDAGPDNSDTEPDRCRSDCSLPHCGDGVVDLSLGEACDDGADNSDHEPNHCRSDCSEPICGDGVVDDAFSEVCDDGQANTLECVELEGCAPGCLQITSCLCVDPISPPCPTELEAALKLQPVAAPGLFGNTAVADGWQTSIDARGGGYNANPPDAYVYGRFTDQGLVKVEVDDLSAIQSMDWHIAMRRFVLRLNGGTSGPSCAAAAALPAQTVFEDVIAVPEGLSFATDSFLDESCGWLSDDSGLSLSPRTALAGFWTWSGCVRMTGTVFVVELPDARTVKLEVLRYYDLPSQQLCQSSGTAGTSAISGDVQLRWAFVD